MSARTTLSASRLTFVTPMWQVAGPPGYDLRHVELPGAAVLIVRTICP